MFAEICELSQRPAVSQTERTTFQNFLSLLFTFLPVSCAKTLTAVHECVREVAVIGLAKGWGSGRPCGCSRQVFCCVQDAAQQACGSEQVPASLCECLRNHSLSNLSNRTCVVCHQPHHGACDWSPPRWHARPSTPEHVLSPPCTAVACSHRSSPWPCHESCSMWVCAVGERVHSRAHGTIHAENCHDATSESVPILAQLSTDTMACSHTTRFLMMPLCQVTMRYVP